MVGGNQGGGFGEGVQRSSFVTHHEGARTSVVGCASTCYKLELNPAVCVRMLVTQA